MYGLESVLAIVIGLMIVGGFWYLNRMRNRDFRSHRPVPVRVRVDDKRDRQPAEPQDDWTIVDEEKPFWLLLMIGALILVIARLV